MVIPKEKIEKEAKENIVNISTISTRLKILEERYTILRKKSSVTDQNLIHVEKNQYDELRLLNDDILKLKTKLKDAMEKLELLTEEVGNFADRRELQVLKKYVEYWEPMDFVTRKEVNDFLRKKFNK